MATVAKVVPIGQGAVTSAAWPDRVHRPDPAVTVSIHSDEDMDDLIRGVVVPFRQQLRRHDPEGRWSLWMIRYGRCGSHLKLRLHGPDREAGIVQRLLGEAVDRHFAAAGPAREEGARLLSRPYSPPIDGDDERSEDYPNRTVLWTHYRRSLVSLGPCRRLVEDDRYVALFTASLAAGAEIVLSVLQPGLSASARLRVLVEVVVAGIGAIDFSPRERTIYLAYHRDWLLRFLLPTSDREREMLGRFDGRLEQLRPLVEQVRRTARGEDPPPAGSVDPRVDFERALADLFSYLVRFRGDPAYVADPFSQDPAFPPVFKVFHGVANQLGVDMLNEALVHHILFHALAEEPAVATASLAGA